MQVFVPYADPYQTAECLDRQRRLKQLTEAVQILDAIDGKSAGWRNHPATKMYAPYREWLFRYKECFNEWLSGNTVKAKWWSNHANLLRPPFMTDEFCDQHKRRLFTKAPELYPQFCPYGESDENWYFVDGELVKYVGGKKI